jgi:hypothetical protein
LARCPFFCSSIPNTACARVVQPGALALVLIDTVPSDFRQVIAQRDVHAGPGGYVAREGRKSVLVPALAQLQQATARKKYVEAQGLAWPEGGERLLLHDLDIAASGTQRADARHHETEIARAALGIRCHLERHRQREARGVPLWRQGEVLTTQLGVALAVVDSNHELRELGTDCEIAVHNDADLRVWRVILATKREERGAEREQEPKRLGDFHRSPQLL